MCPTKDQSILKFNLFTNRWNDYVKYVFFEFVIYHYFFHCLYLVLPGINETKLI